jgi:hypothetical protein
MIDRRMMIGMLAVAIPAAACSKPAKAAELKIYKSPYCGCCGAWVDHVRTSGLKVVVQETEDVTPIAMKLGVPDAMRSCHTAVIDGYFVEGHVPVTDIRKLLRERPKARGIAVPGMPIGSPGMEQGNRRDAYDTQLVMHDGSSRSFVKHNRPANSE